MEQVEESQEDKTDLTAVTFESGGVYGDRLAFDCVSVDVSRDSKGRYVVEMEGVEHCGRLKAMFTERITLISDEAPQIGAPL